MQDLDVVGSDVQNFSCPLCQSTDRERHLFLYFELCDVWNQISGSLILHIAPEKHLRKAIQSYSPGLYITADLVARRPNALALDFSQIPLPDSTVDLLIANHVLEHVSDVKQSLDEAARVLKPGGIAVLQTPYSRTLHSTLELEGVSSAEARALIYGQKDHLRLFGRDIFEIIEEAGFEDCCCPHSALKTIDAGVCGVNSEEPFFLFRKAA
jgi:SAM-dependent methyltransferase